MQELGTSSAELARQPAVPVNRITQIINGQRAITAETALRLGHRFDTGPQVWLSLQQLYEPRRVRETAGVAIGHQPTRPVSPPSTLHYIGFSPSSQLGFDDGSSLDLVS